MLCNEPNKSSGSYNDPQIVINHGDFDVAIVLDFCPFVLWKILSIMESSYASCISSLVLERFTV